MVQTMLMILRHDLIWVSTFFGQRPTFIALPFLGRDVGRYLTSHCRCLRFQVPSPTCRTVMYRRALLKSLVVSMAIIRLASVEQLKTL